MLNVVSTVFYKLLIMLMSFSALFGSMQVPSVSTPVKAENEAEVKLTAALWADPQVSDYILSREPYLKNSCIDLAAAESDIDALVIAGDIAENGHSAEYQLTLDDMSVLGNVKNYVICPGNHDVRLKLYSQSLSRFSAFCNSLTGNSDISSMYYSKQINGYTFIVLGTARTEFEESYFSPEELAWFENELNTATASGQPVFVICHQPLAYTHGLPGTWNSPIESAGSVGKQSDDIRGIMNKYSNVFFITGHLHTGFGEYTFEEADNIHCVNLPSLGIKNGDGYINPGSGYMLEVYSDKVLFRARDFALGINLPSYDMEYQIVK